MSGALPDQKVDATVPYSAQLKKRVTLGPAAGRFWPSMSPPPMTLKAIRVQRRVKDGTMKLASTCQQRVQVMISTTKNCLKSSDLWRVEAWLSVVEGDVGLPWTSRADLDAKLDHSVKGVHNSKEETTWICQQTKWKCSRWFPKKERDFWWKIASIYGSESHMGGWPWKCLSTWPSREDSYLHSAGKMDVCVISRDALLLLMVQSQQQQHKKQKREIHFIVITTTMFS